MLFQRPVFLEWDTTKNPMATDLLKNSLQLTKGVFPVPEEVGIGV
jgi:hypothetical protein